MKQMHSKLLRGFILMQCILHTAFTTCIHLKPLTSKKSPNVLLTKDQDLSLAFDKVEIREQKQEDPS